MAKRKQLNSILSVDEMTAHMEALGFKGAPSYYVIDQYRRWCELNGFEFGADYYTLEGKQRSAAEREYAYFQEHQKASKELERLYKNPARLIHAACHKTINPKYIQQEDTKKLCELIIKKTKHAHADDLEAFLLTVHKRGRFLFDLGEFAHGQSHYAIGALHLFDRRKQWLRPIEDWKPKSHNRHKQFISLAEHLLAQYKMPAFMATVWLRQDRGSYKLRNWYVHMGRGSNIRSVKLPLALSKKMAHHFCLAPADASFESALRWGQIHALGGDKRLCNAILGSRIGTDFSENDFWKTVFSFFIDNPMLDRQHVGPIIDYLHAQKFDREEVIVGPGEVEQRDPPQPNLSMRGRNPDTLLRQVEQWHTGLHKQKSHRNAFFKRSGIKEFHMATGSKAHKRIWTIRELLSSAALRDEGKAMNHCVGTYAASCVKGLCSIWALESKDVEGKVKKHQTIEVNSNNVIFQSRGKNNCLPIENELNIIQSCP